MLSLLLIYCNTLDAVETEKIYPEELEVSSIDYNQFVVSYNQFYNNLHDSKKEIISEYVRLKMESSCNAGQQMACGTYGPIASCKCEDNDQSVI